VSEDICAVCGKPIQIGEWPCVYTPRPHERSVQTAPFVAYYDHGLGMEITGLGDRQAEMRRNNLHYREHPSKGDLSARRDRLEERRRARLT
jgi:hypothetical protein